VSIYAYTGLPGSGKTHSVVEHQILPALKSGVHVVTNVPLKFDLLKSEVGGLVSEFPMETVAADPDRIDEFCPAGCVLVLDEVWRLFPAGRKADQVPVAFRSFLAEHRHKVDAGGRSTQIVLVTQDLAQISAFARQLIEQTFRTVKLTSVGLQSRYRVDVFIGPAMGPNPPISGRTRQMFGKYDPKVYRFYVSHTQSEAGEEGADERAIDKRGNVLRRPLLLMAPVVCILLGWFGVHTLLKSHERLVGGGPRSGPFQSLPIGGFPGGQGPVRVVSGPAEKHASWRVSALLGDGAGGGWAWLTDEVVTVWVPIGECLRGAHHVACLYDGASWDESGRIDGHAPTGVIRGSGAGYAPTPAASAAAGLRPAKTAPGASPGNPGAGGVWWGGIRAPPFGRAPGALKRAVIPAGESGRDWWARTRGHRPVPASWGLSHSAQGTRDVRNDEFYCRRMRRMRAGVLTAARLAYSQFEGDGFRQWFVTLTYSPGEAWRPADIRGFCKAFREWGRRQGCEVAYVWKLELTRAGAPHYHVLLFARGYPWLPKLEAWWGRGSTNCQVARNAVGYVAKYLSKDLVGRLPDNARLWGFGGLDGESRGELRWWRAPRWLRAVSPLVDGIRRLRGGWWLNLAAGIAYRSPYEWDSFEFRRFFIGWADNVRFDGYELEAAQKARVYVASRSEKHRSQGQVGDEQARQGLLDFGTGGLVSA
jgi:Zonular occludens toxin (Zot)